MSELIKQPYQIEVSFIAGLDGIKGDSCKLGLPKLEPINIATDARNRTIAQIAMCLISIQRDGITKDCSDMPLSEKVAISRNWHCLDLKEIAKHLPKLLAEYYLNPAKPCQ